MFFAYNCVNDETHLFLYVFIYLYIYSIIHLVDVFLPFLQFPNNTDTFSLRNTHLHESRSCLT